MRTIMDVELVPDNGITTATVTGVAVLDKSVAILRAFRAGDAGLQPRTVADRTGIALPTAYRLMQAMAAHDLLQKEGRGYRLGMTLLHLGGRVAGSLELRHAAAEPLSWLNAQTGENSELHVRRGEARVPLDVVLSKQNLRPFVVVGEAMPLHLGASGAALLAWLPFQDAAAAAAASAARFDPNRAFDVATFGLRLEQVRAAGWAESNGERTPGVAAIAAPVVDSSGDVIGAIVLSGPATRLGPERRSEFVPLVREAAARASRDSGYVDEVPAASTRERHGRAS